MSVELSCEEIPQRATRKERMYVQAHTLHTEAAMMEEEQERSKQEREESQSQTLREIGRRSIRRRLGLDQTQVW
jgi:hypothetical protein